MDQHERDAVALRIGRDILDGLDEVERGEVVTHTVHDLMQHHPQWRAGALALDREWLAIRLREILDDEWCGTRYDAGVIADKLIKAMREE